MSVTGEFTAREPVQPIVDLPLDARKRLPLVLDSPHSCPTWPDDMRSIATTAQLLTGWDAFVDRIWGGAPAIGGTLIAATFHRCYIDANRSALDIDAELLEQPWPGPALEPSELTARGMGLIRRYALPGVPMYDRKLPVAEVQHRIDHYHAPYHAALTRAVESAHAEFGQSWHINCHSMKSVGNAMNVDNGAQRPDLVIGDVHGTSAVPAFTRWVARAWEQMGYRVAINDPYKGGATALRYGDVAQGRHSILIEVNRRLYMNEAMFEPHDGLTRMRRDADRFLRDLRLYILHQLNKGRRPSVHSPLEPSSPQPPALGDKE